LYIAYLLGHSGFLLGRGLLLRDGGLSGLGFGSWSCLLDRLGLRGALDGRLCVYGCEDAGLGVARLRPSSFTRHFGFGCVEIDWTYALVYRIQDDVDNEARGAVLTWRDRISHNAPDRGRAMRRLGRAIAA
jgi:hypothetical protein